MKNQKLVNFVNHTRDSGSSFKIKCEEGAKSATIYIYGIIGDWFDDLDQASLARQITSLDVDAIDLRISSPGGSVVDAHTIYNLLKAHKAKVTTFIDGAAWSAASYLALAGDEVRIASNATMMIHNPWTIAVGTAQDLRKEAEILDTLRDTISGIYEKRTAKDSKEIHSLMDAETWFKAEEAVEFGFADMVDEPNQAAALMKPYEAIFSGNRINIKPEKSDQSNTQSKEHFKAACKVAALRAKITETINNK